MIDVNEIKTGDCLAKLQMAKSKVCFVLFPYMTFNVCIRHEYEFTGKTIRLTHYMPMAPSDLNDYDYIPVVTFKKLAQHFNDAIRIAHKIVTESPRSVSPIYFENPCQLYKLITGDYIVMLPNGAITEDSPRITVSLGELARSAAPLQDWETGGAKVRYVSLSTYNYLRDFLNDVRRDLIQLFKAYQENKKAKAGE